MDKEQTAIARLREASKMSLEVYEQPLMITTSGGKDSSVLCELAHRAGIPYEVVHSHTTADAPETVRFVRQDLARIEARGGGCVGVDIKYPYYKGKRVSMWSLIPQKLMPPTRLVRYCCSILKETAGRNRFIATGVRWAESPARKNGRGIYDRQHRDKERRVILNNDNDETRRLFENCQLKARRAVNPIIDWTDAAVWDFLDSERIPVNPLYECGFKRIGCIGCPMANKGRSAEFARYPKYRDNYIRAFGRMLEVRKARGIESGWQTATDVYNWWMEYDILPGQMSFDEMDLEDEEE